MINLKEKIKEIIIREKNNNHFKQLDLNSSVDLLQLILENYETCNNLKQDFSSLPKEAELILLMAPTGAGKDALAIELNVLSPNKNYIELNMDIFRHYFPLFIKDKAEISDKNFAEKTNQFSYEILMTLQEIILNEFPGTNIIITGTLRSTSWPEQIIKNYKNSKTTNYKVRLITLAIPKRESAFSTIKRYAQIIDNKANQSVFLKGSNRYTSLEYHDETFEKFAENFSYFERLFKANPGKLIDCIEVYKRNQPITNFYDDNLVYTSENNPNTDAITIIKELRNQDCKLDIESANYILDIIINNIDYLKTQDTFFELMNNVKTLLNL